MGDLRIETCELGMVRTNCYIVYSRREAVVIDPADNGDYIVNKCRDLGVVPKAVLLTHGHFDHILAVKDLKRRFCIPVYAGEMEAPMIQDPSLNLSARLGQSFTFGADQLMKDGETIVLLEKPWKVIWTPGHTSGSVCYLPEGEDILFSGDTLFAESLGRTDLPTGSPEDIIRSITEKLFELPDGIMVYPGHGTSTTIGHEKQYNPAARYRRRQNTGKDWEQRT